MSAYFWKDRRSYTINLFRIFEHFDLFRTLDALLCRLFQTEHNAALPFPA